MEDALRAKFEQSAALRQQLLDTEARLAAHDPTGTLETKTALSVSFFIYVADAHFGDGPDGRGANRLGVLLMKVRYERKRARPPLVTERLFLTRASDRRCGLSRSSWRPTWCASSPAPTSRPAPQPRRARPLPP